MKKAIVVLLVLAFVGAVAFADDATVKFTGAVEGGAKIVNNSSGTTIQQYTNNEGTVGWANLAMTATLGDFSASFYLRSDNFTTWTIPNAWVTEKLLNDMLELRAGVIDNGATGTANQGWGGISGTGIQVVVNPISGLTLGGLIPAPLPTATSATTYDTTATAVVDDKGIVTIPGFATATTYAPSDITDALKTFKIGAAYTMENLVGIALTYQGAGEFDAGINVLAVPNLTLQVEAKILTASGSAQTLYENVAYALGSLSFGVNSTQTIPASGDLGLTVTPNVSYTIGDVPSVGAQVAYTLADSVVAPEVWVKLAFNSMAYLKLQYDYTTKDSSSTINVNFVHSF